MAAISNIDLVRRVPMFSVLTEAQAWTLSQSIVKKRYKRGESIVEQGGRSNALFIILAGRARVVSVDAKGREVILAVLHPGDHVGEMSLIDGEPHSASVSAEAQTDVLMLGRVAFLQSLPENSSMSFSIMRGLVHRLRRADSKIESLALMDVYGRVARALMEMSEEDGAERIIGNKLSRQDLAKMVGASREMVSRVMKDFEQQGLVVEREDGSTIVREHMASLL
ncbi:MAG: Crp/Fnr family transcriptional regulator [Proteobacteria bacterium]|uniref:Crp/Fnr family transcriptional regulator n=1 Tax=Thiomonas sp. FB-Cd TaxID=1158292 RepID=UPI0004DF4A39|nr:Crp/Fnr family transcriptional regulator [Thiomonas sp. FB-Cd]MBW4046746.1 Crp/Fnr family transcriptional regulator [Pseudomonadota bacterium]